MTRLPRRPDAGFTLVEILVVIAILAALAALLTPSLRRARLSATINTTVQDVQRLTLALVVGGLECLGRPQGMPNLLGREVFHRDEATVFKAHHGDAPCVNSLSHEVWSVEPRASGWVPHLLGRWGSR